MWHTLDTREGNIFVCMINLETKMCFQNHKALNDFLSLCRGNDFHMHQMLLQCAISEETVIVYSFMHYVVCLTTGPQPLP